MPAGLHLRHEVTIRTRAAEALLTPTRDMIRLSMRESGTHRTKVLGQRLSHLVDHHLLQGVLELSGKAAELETDRTVPPRNTRRAKLLLYKLPHSQPRAQATGDWP